MAIGDLDELVGRMDLIAKAVNSFNSEAVQLQAFSSLMTAFGLNKKRPDAAEEPEDTSPTPDIGSKRSRRVTRKPKSADRIESPTGLDVNDVVNQIKSHENFEQFYKKIIIGDASRSQKIKFVAWFVNKPLTSGDMQRVLNGLGVKMDAPTASKAVGDARHDLLKIPNGRATLFQLTAKARAEYETWLMTSGEA